MKLWSAHRTHKVQYTPNDISSGRISLFGTECGFHHSNYLTECKGTITYCATDTNMAVMISSCLMGFVISQDQTIQKL